MSLFDRLKRLWALTGASLPPTQDIDAKKSPPKIAATWSHLASWPESAKIETFVLPKPFPGVLPKGVKLATDEAIAPIYNYVGAVGAYGGFGVGEGLGFPGYAYLAELTQRPEYRRPSEVIAKEMTRKWLHVVSTGDDDEGPNLAQRATEIKKRWRNADPADKEGLLALREEWLGILDEIEQQQGAPGKADKIKAIEAEFKRLGVQKLFCDAAEQDGWYGRSQLWMELCKPDDVAELKTPIALDDKKIPKGALKSLRLVDAMWTYPGQYDASNPLRRDFFRPQTWYVMGLEVHATRLLTFISRPLPDILKPAYQFGGLSLSQMLKPYVDNWLRTRQSVSNGISNFSIMILLTDLAQQLQGGGGIESVMVRAQAFNKLRDNNGLMLGDKATEDLKNVSMPLGSLDMLQAQSQEHMCAVTGIPLVKAFGLTPSGLNASSEGEIKVFYDEIESRQEAVFTPNMEILLKVAQLSLFGEIDPEITHIWEPLWSLNALEVANARKIETETDEIMINAGIIDPSEARERVANEEDSPYATIDISKEIEAPEQEESEELGHFLTGLGGGNTEPVN
jgi:phage-related protein (TIGR01555 family)